MHKNEKDHENQHPAVQGLSYYAQKISSEPIDSFDNNFGINCKLEYNLEVIC